MGLGGNFTSGALTPPDPSTKTSPSRPEFNEYFEGELQSFSHATGKYQVYYPMEDQTFSMSPIEYIPQNIDGSECPGCCVDQTLEKNKHEVLGDIV